MYNHRLNDVDEIDEEDRRHRFVEKKNNAVDKAFVICWLILFVAVLFTTSNIWL